MASEYISERVIFVCLMDGMVLPLRAMAANYQRPTAEKKQNQEKAMASQEKHRLPDTDSQLATTGLTRQEAHIQATDQMRAYTLYLLKEVTA